MHAKTQSPLAIELQGGLGNQLFQYQFAIYLMSKFGKEVGVSRSKIEKTNLHHGGRDITSLRLNDEVRVLPGKWESLRKNAAESVRMFEPIRNMLKHASRAETYFSKEIGFDQELEDLLTSNRSIKRINGYFQSWKYSENTMPEMYELFNQIEITNTYLSKLESIFRLQNTSIIHIRLGDYRLKSNSYFGILSPHYYLNCLNSLRAEAKDCEIFVFSDEIDIAKNLYSSVMPKNVNWVRAAGTFDAIEVLKLMSLGRNFVIGNSTFSWWAAKVSENKGVVIAPRKWFKHSKDPQDLCPPKWNRIDSEWE